MRPRGGLHRRTFGRRAEVVQPAEKLRGLARGALTGAGVPAAEGEVVADALLEAELRGRPTHGLLRLPGICRRFASRGPTHVTAVADGGAWLHLDGGDGIGYVIAQRATELARERAREHGLSLVGVRRATHCGMLGYFTAQLALEGLVALMMTDCGAMVAPFGATSAVLGTNPLSIAFPHEPFPVLIDMGTSAATFGDVLVALREGRPLPEGAVYDASGSPTTDPAAAREGALRPFGAHRGSALALAVQLLSGALVGADPLPKRGLDYGLFLLAIDPGVFGTQERFQSGVQAVVEAVKSARPADGVSQVRVPGERAWRERERRLREGIDIPEGLLAELEDLAQTNPR